MDHYIFQPTQPIVESLIIYSNNSYKRINQLETEVLKRYNRILKPKSVFDSICYYVNLKRSLKHSVVNIILKERKKHTIETCL